MSRSWLFFLALSILLLPLMISGESFWIDEAWAGNFARQPTFAAWQHSFVTDLSAEAQQPLYPLATWLWAQAFGTSEHSLRAENLIWGTLALLALAWVGAQLRCPWLSLLAALQPFFWFYMNEARPYVLQMAIGSCLLAGFVDFLQTKGQGTRWFMILSGTVLVFCHTTMLAPATISMVLGVGAWVAWRRHWAIPRRSLLWLGGAAVLSLPIGVYYVSTLIRGAKGTQIWPVTVKNLAYLAYEFLGLTGLGPSVLKLREMGKGLAGHSMSSEALLFLAPALCLCLLLLLMAAGWPRRGEEESAVAFRPAPFLLVVGLVVALFSLVGAATHKAFWARHFSAVFPFYLAALGLLLRHVGQRAPRSLWLGLTGVLLLFFVVSSTEMRWGSEHRKEDYRTAAAEAKKALAAHESVWWIASKEAAEYYQLPFTLGKEQPGSAFIFRERESKTPEQDLVRPLPAMVAYSRPEAFDEDGQGRAILTRHAYALVKRFNGFEIYRRPSTADPASSSPLR